ncbi:hypothetical protein TCAL_12159 [Tigriopus californicus]|uniref:Kinesin-like protein 6 n=1 Tax=Tigriopus californicus TaxID=6832 RepID=A0A553NT75_TIGCA|nr:hypothetical protein TCAL_12159 [Tigriopus californicus]
MGQDGDGDIENVKVAVRVRPFNKREKDRRAKLIIGMNGNTTVITNPETKEDKKFAFDYSYWSFDGCKDRKDGYTESDKKSKNGDKFCDQNKVFNEIGRGILENAWKGLNSSLFAYGQTGSGKSWSVIGYGANKGIVPLLCEELFKEIKSRDGSNCVFEVKFSMLEIYNEVVHDLLDPKAGKKKGGLKVRQHPKKGFYADGLKEVVVGSYEEIVEKMDEGTVNRTVASTNMNATSSRAHTIVGINFVQISKNAAGKEMSKGAVINLVDLAGSERVDSTGATGDRLKEGAGINKSLSCLGNVIHALADEETGKKSRVPYRDSVLTKLLQNALGGNSKTVMIAAISPADINYDESLSTLRFADRAKQIKTKATVNEDQTEKMLRELKAENERLLLLLNGGKMNTQDVKDFTGKDVATVNEDQTEKMLRELKAENERLLLLLNGQDVKDFTGKDVVSKGDMESVKSQWEEELKASLAENAKNMEDMKRSYEEKLKAYTEHKTLHVDHARTKIDEKKKTVPHLYNLNVDPQLSGRIVHFVEKDSTEIGNQKGQTSDICMVGAGIHQEHAIIRNNKDKFTIKPKEKDCRILVNGTAIAGETDLDHNDRLVFGSTQTWLFQNPNEPGIDKKKYPPINFEFAQEEIAAKAGININQPGMGDGVLPEQLIECMPAVEEANSISEELDKRVKFEIMLISPEMLSKLKGKHEGFENHNMKSTTPEVCVKMKNLENGTEFIWPKEKFLNRLYLMKEMYSNYEEEEDEWDLPEENDPFQVDVNEEVLIGAVPVFLQTVAYMDVYCKYTMYLDDEKTETEKISFTPNPEFNHKKKFSFYPATQQLIDYLYNGCVNVELWGRQNVRKSAVAQRKGLSTKDMLKQDRGVFSKTANLMNGFQMNGRVVDPQKQSVIVELLLLKKTAARLQQKCDHVKTMLEHAESMNRSRISTHVVKAVYSANTDDQYRQAIKALEADVDGDDDSGHHSRPGSAQNSSVCVIL